MTLQYNPNIKYYGKRLLFVVIILLMIFLVFFFRIEKLYIKEIDQIIYNPLYEFTSQVELWIYLLIYFVFVFIINSIFLFLLTLFTTTFKHNKEKKSQNYAQLFSNEIINILEADAAKQSQEKIFASVASLKRQLNSYIKSRTYLDVLLKISNLVKGDLQKRLNALFFNEDYDFFIKTHLLSPYFQDKIFALKLISSFKLNKFENYVRALTNEKNYILRTEAYVTLIKISDFDNLSFLKTHKYNISELDTNIILNVVKEYDKKNIDILGLIESNNPKASALGLIFAEKFGKLEYKELIQSKTSVESSYLRFEAYHAFISMSKTESDYNFLIDRFPKESEKIKILIIKGFKNCPNINLTTAFLLSAIEEETVLIKVEALKLLIDVNVNYVLAYRSSSDGDIQKALKQVLDFNLIS